MAESCPACASTNTVLLRRRSLWLCGDCETWFDKGSSAAVAMAGGASGAGAGVGASAGAGAGAGASPTKGPPGPPALLTAQSSFLSSSAPLLRSLSLYCTRPLTVFLSYGHDGFTDVSRHLKAVLESRGHRVWFDEDSLVVGRPWADLMADGLESVEAAGDRGRVVFMLAEWGIRRVGSGAGLGFCMNELSKAVRNPRIQNNPGVNKCLVVVKLQDAEPPSSIHGRTVFDMSDVMPPGVDPTVWKAPPDPCGNLARADWDAHFASPEFQARLWKLVEVIEMDCLEPFIDPEHISTLKEAACTPTPLPMSPPPAPAAEAATCRVYICCEPKFLALGAAIATALTSAGFAVWFKPESLDAAHPDYDPSKRAEHVEQGLQWASTEGAPTDGPGKCVAVLTPGAVQRSTGFCADELLKAFTKGLFFVPLMVRRCEAPLHMCSIQWLEFKSTVNDAGDIVPDHFAAALPKLVRALRGGQLDMEGKQARLISTLSPLDFETEMASLVETFEGREWAVNAVDAFLSDASSGRLLWFTGKMGLGKSALAAYLAANRAAVLAYHLATPVDDAKCDARRAVLSLAYQLCTQLESVWDNFFKHKLLEDAIQVKTAEALFEMLIVRPLTEVTEPPQPAALLVDGLDAMTEAGRNEFARILALAVRPDGMTLPPWLKLIVFSRDDPVVAAALSTTGTSPVNLTLQVDNLNADLRNYLHRVLLPFSDSAPATATEPPADVVAATSTLIDNADGLFLYCQQFVQSLSQGQVKLSEMDKIPVGIDGMLHDAMQRMFKDADSYARLCRPAMAVLVAAEEPITVDMLRDVLGWDSYHMQEASASLRCLFTFHKGHLKPFHAALLDWVADPARAGGFLADKSQGHRFLADWAWSCVRLETTAVGGDTNNLPKYIVRHAKTHMATVRHAHLSELLSNEAYLTAKRLLDIQDNGMNSFFHGTISRDTAVALLTGKPSGTFLIRYSERASTYCVSFLDPMFGGAMKHNLLYLINLGAGKSGYSEMDPRKFVQGVNTLYPSLGDFVEAYQRKGRLRDAVPCARP